MPIPATSLLGAIAWLGITSTAAVAGSSTSIAALLKQGYEIKATVVISLQDIKANNPNAPDKGASLVVTLQKGPSIGVCTFGIGAWETIGSSTAGQFTLEDRCDVQAP